jgi:hypothetical protein
VKNRAEIHDPGLPLGFGQKPGLEVPGDPEHVLDPFSLHVHVLECGSFPGRDHHGRNILQGEGESGVVFSAPGTIFVGKPATAGNDRMHALIQTFLQILPVFFLVGLGYFLRSIRFLDAGFVQSLSRLVFYVLLPPLMFLGIAQTRLSESFEPAVIGWSLFGVALFSTLTFLATARWVDPSRRGVLTQGASRSNLAFVGLAILLNLYGETILGKAAVFIAFQAFLINLLTILFLLLPHYSLRNPSNWKRIGTQLALNPIVLGCAFGMAFSALGYELTETIKRTLTDLATPTLPLALMTVGASLGASPIRERLGLVMLATLLKLLVLPALIWFLLHAAQVPHSSLVMSVVLLGSPTAVTSFIMAKEMEGDENLASAIIMATTILSPLTLTAWIGFLS